MNYSDDGENIRFSKKMKTYIFCVGVNLHSSQTLKNIMFVNYAG
jgi:hypothetical protein